MAQTYVYVLSHLGRCKIGISYNPSNRCRDLSNASGLSLVLRAKRPFSSRTSAMFIEATLHKRYRQSRTRGEWFETDPHAVCMVLRDIEDPGLEEQHDNWDVAV